MTKIDFDGDDYKPKLDRKRLKSQLDNIRNLMLNRDWTTLKQIAELTGYPEASVSAQLRNLRKERFGGYTVEKIRFEKSGTYYYKLVDKFIEPPF